MNQPRKGDGNIYASGATVQGKKGILGIDETGIRFQEIPGKGVLDIPFSKITDAQITGILAHRISLRTEKGKYSIKVGGIDHWLAMILIGVRVTRKVSGARSARQNIETKTPKISAPTQSTSTQPPAGTQNPLVEQIQKRKIISQRQSGTVASTAATSIITKPEYRGSWPNGQDYEQSFQSPTGYIHPSLGDIKSWKVSRNPKNLSWLVQASGNYGSIYRIEDGNGKTFAIKCFTKKSAEINERYQIIHSYLQSIERNKLPLIDFSYFPDGIRTRRDPSYYFPVVKMPWIEGKTLNRYIGENLTKPKTFEGLADRFLSAMKAIQDAGLAHGDLSGDNIIVEGRGNLVLVDYDGMFVPPLRGKKATENGHADFQHPARTRDNFSRNMDNFSVLVVYLSLLVLAKRPELWEKYNGDDPDCLILRKTDFLDPEKSQILSTIASIRSPKIRKLKNLLIKALSNDPEWNDITAAALSSI